MPDAAIRALTINASRIAGAADRLGSLERGKIANLLITEWDLFDERLQIKHVFVDGRMVHVGPQPGRTHSPASPPAGHERLGSDGRGLTSRPLLSEHSPER